MDLSTLYKTLFSLFVSIFTWEHIGRLYDVNVRPTFILDSITTVAIDVWEFCGRCFAYVSSFIYHLKLKEVAITFKDIGCSSLNFFFAPMFFLEGYFEIAKTYLNVDIIVVGSAIIVVVIVIALVYWAVGNPCRKVRDKVGDDTWQMDERVSNFILYFGMGLLIYFCLYMLYLLNVEQHTLPCQLLREPSKFDNLKNNTLNNIKKKI